MSIDRLKERYHGQILEVEVLQKNNHPYLTCSNSTPILGYRDKYECRMGYILVEKWELDRINEINYKLGSFCLCFPVFQVQLIVCT